MGDENSMSEAEMDAAIHKHILERERDPQLRIAESLAEIAIQLERLNENLEYVNTTAEKGLSEQDRASRLAELVERVQRRK